MIKTNSSALVLAGVLLAAPAASAQSLAAENEDHRYTFNRIDEGFLRLDGRTGQVSLCSRRSVGWACQLVPDERSTLEAEIVRLQGESALLKNENAARKNENASLKNENAALKNEIASLKKELAARDQPPPQPPKPEPPPVPKVDVPPAAKPGEPGLSVPGDADLNKMVDFIEKVWRRLVEMIVTMQKDMMKKS